VIALDAQDGFVGADLVVRLVQQCQVQTDPEREQRNAGQRQMQCEL
jgi:hypothetical protein